MTTRGIIELALAIALVAAGVWLYRRNRDADRGYGSQGAVLLFVIAVLLAVHGLGLMQYRPSAAETEAMQGHGQ